MARARARVIVRATVRVRARVKVRVEARVRVSATDAAIAARSCTAFAEAPEGIGRACTATGVATGTATCIWTPPPCVAGAVDEAVVGVTCVSGEQQAQWRGVCDESEAAGF